MDKVRLTRIQNRLDYRHKFVVPRKNKACGLVLFWKDEFNLEVKTFLKNHIDTTINKTTEDEWRFTGLYDEPDTSKRHESWDRLCNLKNGGSMTWILADDFNEITRQSEKKGGRVRPHSQMQPFRKALDEYGFMDMGFVGSKFTWHKHLTDYIVWEWLDRVVATNSWFTKFSNTKIYHLDVTISDHKPLWIVPEVMDGKQQWPFHF